MFKKYLVILFFCCAVFYGAADETEDVSYAFGMYVAWDLMDSGLDINSDAFFRGFRDFLESGDARFSMDEAVEILQNAFDRLHAEERERSSADAEVNRQAGAAFLAQNSQRPGVIVTSSGLQMETLREGTGGKPNIADYVLVDYTGTLIDGTVFDSSYIYGEPVAFSLDMVIPGWSEGLQMMREGGRAMLYLPPELAYRDMDLGIIAPHSVLIFDVEFHEIVR